MSFFHYEINFPQIVNYAYNNFNFLRKVAK